MDSDGPIRHAVEIRHESFCTPDFTALLRRHGVALVVADTVAWPLLTDATADFMYVRLHGSKELYTSGYGPRALVKWARWIRAWSAGRCAAKAPRIDPKEHKTRPREVFVYFDNDAKVRAPRDALALGKLLRS